MSDDRNGRDHRERAAAATAAPRDAPPRAVHEDVGVATARERFGGIDLPATLVGMLTALAMLVLLGGIVAAALGAIGYQKGLDTDDVTASSVDEISLAGLIGGVALLFLAYLVGGWAAARIARYDGPRNGLMTGIWTLLLAAVLSGLGAWLGAEYDVLRNVDLPQWFSRDAVTAGAIVSGVVAILAMLLGGLLGGAWGERYHRRADAQIAWTRPGGIERRDRVETRG